MDNEATKMTRYLPLALTLLALATPSGHSSQAPSDRKAAGETFRAPDGQTYRVTLVPALQKPEPEERELVPEATKGTGGDTFTGVARKGAKTLIAAAPVTPFPSTGAFLDALLNGKTAAANDAAMRAKLKPSSPRVAEELRNAHFSGFLYAAKKESDNDFHLLVGGVATSSDPRYLTCEVSGLPLPPNAASNTLTAARKQFKTFFAGLNIADPTRYTVFTPPIPVTITGSAFFDIDHRPGEIGTKTIVPATSWEVHPVTAITFP
jgi:hypothetical protein